ncbi:MAG: hypothetical protein V7K89_05715 [Nostoc sp.]|uniref:hypothetical protein n=1 Tax=Nostoc sp. TaxID=1180 RepID=UPI002FF9FA15
MFIALYPLANQLHASFAFFRVLALPPIPLTPEIASVLLFALPFVVPNLDIVR